MQFCCYSSNSNGIYRLHLLLSQISLVNPENPHLVKILNLHDTITSSLLRKQSEHHQETQERDWARYQRLRTALCNNWRVLFLLGHGQDCGVVALCRFVELPVAHLVSYQQLVVKSLGLVPDQFFEVFGIVFVIYFDEGSDGDFEYFIGISRRRGQGSTPSAPVSDLTVTAFHLKQNEI